ncbi:MAG: hypothetical protein PHD72_04070 [Patescibacteria group bacterium]|nr:hypothetical protein [Patescibacteria group bacterium]
MIPDKKGRLSWREALKFINKCPVCGSVYATDRARLFAEEEQANLIHISCANCQSNFIAMVLVLGHGLSTIGMVSDLNYDDAKKMHALAPIAIDEMIEGHKIIQEEKFLLKIT